MGNKSSRVKSKEIDQAADIVVNMAMKNGIRLLAIDFDHTFISCHTGGMWNDSAEKLAKYVRPFFRNLMEKALLTEHMYVSIVTFSGQINLIEDVIKLSIQSFDSQRFFCRGNNGNWERKGSCNSGKQQHLFSICEEIRNKYGETIQHHEILLLDDDVNNINSGKEDGIFAAHFNPVAYNGELLLRNHVIGAFKEIKKRPEL